jgi:hypothetical protein
VNDAPALAQLRLYETAGVRQPLVHCFVASVGDGVMVLVVIGVVSAVHGSTTSLSAPRSGDHARSKPNERAAALIWLVRKYPDTLERLAARGGRPCPGSREWHAWPAGT